MTPYLLLNKKDMQVLDIITRKVVKQAIGGPMSASISNPLESVFHNTVDGPSEAHLANQKLRLS